jgi:hypothetical protein
MIVEMLVRLDMITPTLHNQEIRGILTFMAPWVGNMRLSQIKKDAETSAKRQSDLQGTEVQVLEPPEIRICLMNLFYMTIRFCDDFPLEVETIWLELVEKEDDEQDDDVKSDPEMDISIILDYIYEVCIRKRNPSAIAYSKSIIIFLSRGLHGASLLESLMDRLTPAHSIPQDREMKPPEMVGTLRSMPIDPVETVLLDMPAKHPLSTNQISLALLSECILQIDPRLILPHAAHLAHAAIVHLDHFSSFVAEESLNLLNALVQALVPDERDLISVKFYYEEGRIPYEDLKPPQTELETLPVYEFLVDRLLDILSRVLPEFRRIWGAAALEWGLNCSISHLACRSLQVYRCLSSPVWDKRSLAGLMARCGSLLGDPVREVQGYALDGLLTLRSCAERVNPPHQFLELWWAGLACLYSPHLWEYEQGLKLLLESSCRLDLNDSKVLEGILICRPMSWRGSGVLDMLLKGLTMDSVAEDALTLLNRLVTPPQPSEILDTPERRLLYGILANLPQMMLSLGKGFGLGTGVTSDGASGVFSMTSTVMGGGGASIMSGANSDTVSITLATTLSSVDVHAVAKELCVLASSQGFDHLSHLLLSFSKQKFRSREDFSSQLWSLLKDKPFDAEVKGMWDFLLKLLNKHQEVEEDGSDLQREVVLHILLAMTKSFGPLELMTRLHGKKEKRRERGEEGWTDKAVELWSPLLVLLHEPNLSPSMMESLCGLIETLVLHGLSPNDSDLRQVFGEKAFSQLKGEAAQNGAGESLSGDNKSQSGVMMNNMNPTPRSSSLGLAAAAGMTGSGELYPPRTNSISQTLLTGSQGNLSVMTLPGPLFSHYQSLKNASAGGGEDAQDAVVLKNQARLNMSFVAKLCHGRHSPHPSISLSARTVPASSVQKEAVSKSKQASHHSGGVPPSQQRHERNASLASMASSGTTGDTPKESLRKDLQRLEAIFAKKLATLNAGKEY